MESPVGHYPHPSPYWEAEEVDYTRCDCPPPPPQFGVPPPPPPPSQQQCRAGGSGLQNCHLVTVGTIYRHSSFPYLPVIAVCASVVIVVLVVAFFLLWKHKKKVQNFLPCKEEPQGRCELPNPNGITYDDVIINHHPTRLPPTTTDQPTHSVTPFELLAVMKNNSGATQLVPLKQEDLMGLTTRDRTGSKETLEPIYEEVGVGNENKSKRSTINDLSNDTDLGRSTYRARRLSSNSQLVDVTPTPNIQEDPALDRSSNTLMALFLRREPRARKYMEVYPRGRYLARDFRHPDFIFPEGFRTIDGRQNSLPNERSSERHRSSVTSLPDHSYFLAQSSPSTQNNRLFMGSSRRPSQESRDNIHLTTRNQQSEDSLRSPIFRRGSSTMPLKKDDSKRLLRTPEESRIQHLLSAYHPYPANEEDRRLSSENIYYSIDEDSAEIRPAYATIAGRKYSDPITGLTRGSSLLGSRTEREHVLQDIEERR